jgi:hypothetical protein
MRQKFGPVKGSAEKVVKDIRRATRRHFSAEDNIRIMLEGLRGEESIVELCRREGIVQSLYYRWHAKLLHNTVVAGYILNWTITCFIAGLSVFRPMVAYGTRPKCFWPRIFLPFKKLSL